MVQLSIDLTQENLLDLKADACICNIHRSRDLKKGKLSSQVSVAAGDKLQRDLISANPLQELQNGEVKEAQPGNLSSKFSIFYFVCLRMWQEGNDDDLQAAIERILDDAGGKKLTSVALPALGTGGQKYPPEKVALAILQGVMAYSIDNPESSIKSVKVSLFEQKDEMLQAFTDILLKAVSVHHTHSQDQATAAQISADDKASKADKSTIPTQDKRSLFAVVPKQNLLQTLWSYFGKPPVVYRFLIGPVPASVSPYVSIGQRGAGVQMTIGLTISIDVLPVPVKNALSKIFKLH